MSASGSDAYSAAYLHALDVFDLPTGSICIRYSHPSNEKPFYLQRVINDRKNDGMFGVHLIENEFYPTLVQAKVAAARLTDKLVYVDSVADSHA